MPDHERAMLTYVSLADLSQQKQQLLGRDKFLILAGAAACRGGWPDVAERCRSLVLENNPFHTISRYASFPDALRNSEFEPFLKQLMRFCPYERAEHLLSSLDVDPLPAERLEESTAGDYALSVLSAAHWSAE